MYPTSQLNKFKKIRVSVITLSLCSCFVTLYQSYLIMDNFSLIPQPYLIKNFVSYTNPIHKSITEPSNDDWTAVFQYPVKITHGISKTQISKRFRLAGVYSVCSINRNLQKRFAIIDDMTKKQQHVVSENDKIDDVEILNIFDNKVVLRSLDGIEELYLSSTSVESGPATQKGIGDTSKLVTSKYGAKRLGEFSWVFQRQNLIDYYKELLSDTSRLVKVFDSMQPVRDELGKITGYKLKIYGEKDFFDVAGLKEGDIIREVNSMPMTSRKLSEYYIGEFIKGRANTFVLGIERDGKLQKQVYQIRD